MNFSAVVVKRVQPCWRRPACRLSHWKRHFSTNGVGNQLPGSSFKSQLKWYALGGLGTSAVTLWLSQANHPTQDNPRPLSRTSYSPSTLQSSVSVNKDSKLLRLVIPPETLPELVLPRAIWSIYIKDSDIQVERPYSPLEGVSSSGEMVFWIKKYPHGEVGRWLHSKLPGETVEVRGPEQTWEWQDGTWDNVIMIAGGTGVTPFYQLLHSQLALKPERSAPTKFTLLQSYRSPSELPPALIHDNLSCWARLHPDRLQIQTFVDNLKEATDEGSLQHGRISRNVVESVLKQAPGGRTIVLVCGPEPMISALAGPKGRDQSQGPVAGILGGILSELNRTITVWKL